MADLRVETADGIATVTLDRPDALNSLTVPLKEALIAAFSGFASDPTVRAVILTGAGRAFCAGQDLRERLEPDAAPLEIELRERYNPLVRAIRALPQPSLAAVNGVAAGAGAKTCSTATTSATAGQSTEDAARARYETTISCLSLDVSRSRPSSVMSTMSSIRTPPSPGM